MNFRGACLHEGCPCAYRDPLTGMCQSPYDKCHISNTSFITKHSEDWKATYALDIYCQIQERKSNCNGKCYKCQLFTTFMDGFRHMMETSKNE